MPENSLVDEPIVGKDISFRWAEVQSKFAVFYLLCLRDHSKVDPLIPVVDLTLSLLFDLLQPLLLQPGLFFHVLSFLEHVDCYSLSLLLLVILNFLEQKLVEIFHVYALVQVSEKAFLHCGVA